MSDLVQKEFDEWRKRTIHRFSTDYIDTRLEKERKKADSLVAKESHGFKKHFSVRATLPKFLKYTSLAYFGAKHANQLRVVEHTLPIVNLPSSFNGFRVLHISDLHFNGNEVLMRKLVSCIKNTRYDICVLTGDYRYRSFGSIELAMDGLRRLCQAVDAEIVSVLGNHDSLLMVPSMESMGITVLLNENHNLVKGEDVIWLIGVDDPSYYRTHDIARATANGKDRADECFILLAHSPNIIRDANRHQINAYLCGHTHGGQICLPGGISPLKQQNLPRKTRAGRWYSGNMVGYTSVGVGASIVEARFFCPPEITVHTFRAV